MRGCYPAEWGKCRPWAPSEDGSDFNPMNFMKPATRASSAPIPQASCGGWLVTAGMGRSVPAHFPIMTREQINILELGHRRGERGAEYLRQLDELLAGLRRLATDLARLRELMQRER